MYTRCPKCETLYPIEAADLRVGRGEALCGQCHIIFSALSALADAPEQAHADPYAVQRVPTLGRNEAAEAKEQPLSLRAEPRPRPATDRPSISETSHIDYFSEFETAPKAASPLWTVAVLAAVIVLIWQALLFESVRLAQKPMLRPWVEALCVPLDCPIPGFRDLSRLQVVERSLTRARDGVDGQEFRAVLANYADQPQPYPQLKLTLSQYNGEPIAQRIFTAQQYLDEAGDVGKMPAGAAVAIQLLIANPGKDVGGFTIELL